MDTNSPIVTTEVVSPVTIVTGFGSVCPVDGCGKRFINDQILDMHRRQQHCPQHYRCLANDCHYESVNDRRPLIEHMVGEHQLSPMVCVYDTCGQLFANAPDFETHVLQRHLTIYRCPTAGCRRNFLAQNLLDSHRKVCQSWLVCGIDGCDYQCDRIDSLNHHMDQHLADKLPDSGHSDSEASGQCLSTDYVLRKYFGKAYGNGKAVVTATTASAPKKPMTIKKRFQCDSCDYQSDRHSDLIRHKRTHARRLPTIAATASTAPTNHYRCGQDSCGRVFRTAELLTKHLCEIHRRFRCNFEDCHKVLKTRLSLTQHRKLHTNCEKRFACPASGCVKLFRTKYNRDTHHRRMHSKTANTATGLVATNAADKVLVCGHEDCTFSTTVLTVLAAHKDSHKDDRNFVCLWPGCTKKYRNKYLLKYHTLNHQWIQCDVDDCGFSCVDKKQMADHKSKQHNSSNGIQAVTKPTSEPIVCGKRSSPPKCEQTVVSSVTVAAHPTGKDRSLKCMVRNCGYRCDNDRDLAKHMTIHAKTSSKQLPKPMNQKEIKTSFRCGHESCGKSFVAEETLNRHLTEMHSTSVTANTVSVLDTTDKVDTEFECDYPDCHKVLKTKQIFLEHKKIHLNNEKQFKCLVGGCEKLFRTKYNRDTHAIRVHRRQHLFQCDWKGCQFTTNQLRPFNAHKATHKQQQSPLPRSPPAPHQPMTSQSQLSLRNHTCIKPVANNTQLKTSQRTSTASSGAGVRNYPCKWTTCRKRFKTRTELNAHSKTHLKNNNLNINTNKKSKKFGCNWKSCTFKATDATKLRSHKRSKHGIKK